MDEWEFFPAAMPDIKNNVDVRWYWRHTTDIYVATSMKGFATIKQCVADAKKNGMSERALIEPQNSSPTPGKT